VVICAIFVCYYLSVGAQLGDGVHWYAGTHGLFTPTTLKEVEECACS